ncbi:hypothetical protein NHF48_004615 [Sphingomonas sp. H160509]|uniref:hypothetical protein n=1 Tax=Sphingomonas sp. H160509 TaxID=2955313 RepID=UPI0020975D0C|nr:hypothetical protein [Sphingomonas sp. H160509]MDD1450442.1 hypothetical protein [Sphingomonas sp. H160509]
MDDAMIGRRAALLGGVALAAGCTNNGRLTGLPAMPAFVTVDGTQFRRGGKPYRYAGANIWYGAWLGAETAYGNRARLGRELDRLKALGVRNLRILGSAEMSPLKNSITPGFRDKTATYNEGSAQGPRLDARRDGEARHDRRDLPDQLLGMVGRNDDVSVVGQRRQVHQHERLCTSVARVRRLERRVLCQRPGAGDVPRLYPRGRLADEHRDGRRLRRGSDDHGVAVGERAASGRRRCGSHTQPARFLPLDRSDRAVYQDARSQPPRLDRFGGTQKGSIEREDVVLAAHRSPSIDYLTTHIWPNNWTWMDAGDLAGTYDAGAAKVAGYIDAHIRLATTLGKPLVIEEFGYPRDGKTAYDPTITTVYKDRFYRQIYAAIEADAKSGGPLAGSNFWAWNGEARTPHADHRFQRGDLGYMGDPPHEPQGWYGVFDSDASTQNVIRAHAAAMAAL